MWDLLLAPFLIAQSSESRDQSAVEYPAASVGPADVHRLPVDANVAGGQHPPETAAASGRLALQHRLYAGPERWRASSPPGFNAGYRTAAVAGDSSQVILGQAQSLAGGGQAAPSR